MKKIHLALVVTILFVSKAFADAPSMPVSMGEHADLLWYLAIAAIVFIFWKGIKAIEKLEGTVDSLKEAISSFKTEVAREYVTLEECGIRRKDCAAYRAEKHELED